MPKEWADKEIIVDKINTKHREGNLIDEFTIPNLKILEKQE